jgi:hypothetical protein
MSWILKAELQVNEKRFNNHTALGNKVPGFESVERCGGNVQLGFARKAQLEASLLRAR